MTAAENATVAVFLKAFRALSKHQRQAFLDGLLQEKRYREDLLDLARAEARRREPSRPLRASFDEREQRSRQ